MSYIPFPKRLLFQSYKRVNWERWQGLQERKVLTQRTVREVLERQPYLKPRVHSVLIRSRGEGIFFLFWGKKKKNGTVRLMILHVETWKNILKNIAGHLRLENLYIYNHVNSYYWINQNIFACDIFAKKSCHVTFKVKVTQWDTTLCDPMDYTVRRIFQARILEYVAGPFPRGSSQARDRIQVSHNADRFFTSWATREALWHLKIIIKIKWEEVGKESGGWIKEVNSQPP